MEKEKIILDVDTGSDDAVALVCAMLSDEFDLLGITTVGGNSEQIGRASCRERV